MAKLNVLYIHSHDAGRLISPYGYATRTPNLYRLAAQGTVFRQAFCCGPTCSPSRAALVTGQSPHACGMLGLAHRGWSLNDYSHHIVHPLRAAGWRSILCGVQHVSGAGGAERIGYDEIVPTASLRGADVAEAARRRIAAGLAEPFFMSVGCIEPHRPFPEPASEEAARVSRAPEPLPDVPATRRDMAGFDVLVERFDGMVGEVLRAIDEAGLGERTIVVCTTDHGPAFPLMKCNLTDGGMGVLLVMRGPGVPVGWSTDALASHIDVVPTLCDLLGLDAPVWAEGRSLGPVLRREAEEVRDEVFGEVTYHAAWEPQRAVRTRRWKYVRRYGKWDRPVLPNCDDGLSKDYMLASGWADTRLPSEGLYDMVFDRLERGNLVGEASAAGVLGEMRDRLKRWMTETGDPLLAGRIVAPAGAVANDVDAMSPQDAVRPAGDEVVVGV